MLLLTALAQAMAVAFVCRAEGGATRAALCLAAVVVVALWPRDSAPAPVPGAVQPGDVDGCQRGEEPCDVPTEPDLGAFLETVNHELRTPLNAILGFSDLLLEEIDGPLSADRRQNVEVIRESGATLLSLFDEVTELTALMGGQVPRGHQDIDLLQTLRGATAVRDGEVVLAAAEGSHRLVGDRARIARAVEQLLACALAHAEGEPPQARLSSDGHALQLTVHVRCESPSDAQLRQLFAAPSTSVTRQRVGGVGPTIAAHVARLHGGQLRAAATASGIVLSLSLSRGAA